MTEHGQYLVEPKGPPFEPIPYRGFFISKMAGTFIVYQANTAGDNTGVLLTQFEPTDSIDDTKKLIDKYRKKNRTNTVQMVGYRHGPALMGAVEAYVKAVGPLTVRQTDEGEALFQLLRTMEDEKNI